ncbi:GTP cyclohydrolase II [Nocardia yamanashiensis]|uniref:GTP cyclohydrolase II n=1 Tax=Nocardia yamanashiensis TaxID=209247 RepID=UPI001E49FA9A|nr:GTP cyclohydrolase II [Nocardia yamanashiensis]UGT43907.1 GTP cyclohydrolase II [Nocardia yamanashiensis]
MSRPDDVLDDGARERDTSHYLTCRGRTLLVRVEPLSGKDIGYAIVFGEGLPRHDCLVRVHSRCLYGEVLGSDDCDCGDELHMSLDLIFEAGTGVLIYLDQEGRGAGLVAKALGYQHGQLTGADTFASYEALGIPSDSRNYSAAAEFLVESGVRSVQLLTNNPDKVRALVSAGLEVEVVPLHFHPRTEWARRYFEAKRTRGHLIPERGRSRIALTPRIGRLEGSRLDRLATAAVIAAGGVITVLGVRRIQRVGAALI